MKLASLPRLTPRPLSGVWYRAIKPQFWGTLLHTAHTRTSSSRFNPGTGLFELFYLAENHLVAMMEVGALVGQATPGGLFASPHHAWSVINVSVRLRSVLDLTRASQRAKLRVTAQELTGDWRAYPIRHQLAGRTTPAPIPPTQRLGSAVHQQPGVEAILTYSAKQPYSSILVVFPQKLSTSSRVVFRDPVSGRTLSLP